MCVGDRNTPVLWGEWVRDTGQCCRARSTTPHEAPQEALGNAAAWGLPANATWQYEAGGCAADRQRCSVSERDD